MKNFKFFNIALLLGLMVFATSCEKYFEGVNDNPNQPESVPPSLLLPSGQMALAYGNGGDISRFTSMFMQQCEGISRQFATYHKYQLSEVETNNWWRFNMYGGGLMDIHLMIQDAEANGYDQYAGVGKILMAYGIMLISDMVGDVPYAEAFATTDNLTPAYDTQSDVYTSIQALLTDAKAHLAEATAPIAPGVDDLIYGGDVDMWTRTANVLSARAYIHLGKRDAANYASALNALGTEGTDSYGSDGESCAITFGTGATESGPWFQYITQRADIAYQGFAYDTMLAMADPRYYAYVDTSNADNTANLGAAFSAADASFYFCSYVEQKFIEAEAAFQTGDLARAATAHNAGVMASLARHGVSDATFEANEASTTSADITLEKIMLHKYIAMFLDPEVFSDWRRTGFPTLTAVPNNVTGGIIPRRLPYPQSERLFNGANFPADNAITSRVWWDQ